ncbi:MAG TPA: hypothetical protein VJ550_15955 [Geomonas sp.]|nr:hypothetical protein [Geomonas sp.]
MKGLLPALLLVFLLCAPLFAASLDTPALSPPIASSRFFDTDRLLTTGGVKYEPGTDLLLEPEWGVGYRHSESGFTGTEDRVHAQAGWRLSLADSWYLSAAAKLSVLTIQSSETPSGQDLGTRRGYDLIHPSKNAAWTSEMGIHLAGGTDLMLYYDRSPLSGWATGGPQQEERVGTRLIFRFK